MTNLILTHAGAELTFTHADATLIARALALAAAYMPSGEITEHKRARLEHMSEDLGLVLGDNMSFRITVRDSRED